MSTYVTAQESTNAAGREAVTWLLDRFCAEAGVPACVRSRVAFPDFEGFLIRVAPTFAYSGPTPAVRWVCQVAATPQGRAMIRRDFWPYAVTPDDTDPGNRVESAASVLLLQWSDGSYCLRASESPEPPGNTAGVLQFVGAAKEAQDNGVAAVGVRDLREPGNAVPLKHVIGAMREAMDAGRMSPDCREQAMELLDLLDSLAK